MKMKNWYQMAVAKLLMVSQALQICEAMLEWKFTGDVKDRRTSDNVCELCGQKNLRYHFQIFNIINGGVLQVGSECIKKFEGISICDSAGRLILDQKERSRWLDQKKRECIDQIREEIMLKPLRLLYRADTSIQLFIAASVDRYKQEGAFPPQHLSELFARMDKHGIQYDPTTFKIRLNSNDYRSQLQRIKGSVAVKIHLAMSSLQQYTFSKFPESA